jgi:2,4-dienoyl-CoA reductase-like NADH-dependent reductase (Old Yellow Enzyme family)/thioredoxin reductase
VPPAPLAHLLSPLRIGPVQLPCRIVSTSHQTTLVHEHLPTEDFVAYQQARARGGAGLIVLEAVAIAPSGLLTAHTLGGYLEGIVAAYRRLGAAITPSGTRLFVQLFHGGRELISTAPRPPAVSASALPSSRYHVEPRALSTSEVQELVAAYGRCAELAARGGLDGIEVTAAHGYLGEQFFDPALNRRSDRYGEPARFLTEVLEAVRRAAPNLALGLRLSADSPAAAEVAPALAPLVDYLHVAVGNSATFAGCSGIVPPPPRPRNLIATLTAPFRLGVPLLATSRIVEPAEADRLIERGVADAVGMTRALICDPQLPRKARSGRTREILRCIGCNACIAHYHAGTPIRCAQNPRTGRERTLGPPQRTGEPRRVVVVGAGPAGLAAAAEAGAAGHQVMLLERSGEIGGQVALAASTPAHREQAEALRSNYATMLELADVQLRLHTDADAELIARLSPDVVILATGAAPAPAQVALEGIASHQAWEVLAGARPDGERVLIADWGGDPCALDCAELLAGEGHRVTIAVGALLPGETVHQYQRNEYLARLYRAGVVIAHHLELRGTSGQAVRFANIFAPELERTLQADALVLSLGRTPCDELARALSHRYATSSAERRPIVVCAGDCCSPRGLEEAILEGTLAAREGTLAAREGTPAAREGTPAAQAGAPASAGSSE